MQMGEQDVRVMPQNVLTFHRNEFQAAATITLFRNPQSKAVIRYALKNTHKRAYLVSSSKGTLLEHQNHLYIDILINQNYSLEQCLLDHFKIEIKAEGKAPFYKTFKVAIKYKKEIQKFRDTNFSKLQVISRTTTSMSTANSTILGQPVDNNKKSKLRQSKLAQCIARGQEDNELRTKLQLENIIKQIEDRRMRLQFLHQQALKGKARKKFGYCLMLALVLMFLLLGFLVRKGTGFDGQQYFALAL